MDNQARLTARLKAISEALDIPVENLYVDPPEGDPSVREAWASLRLIRAAIEELGPVGVLPSAETVQRHSGPRLIDEAAALVEGIRRIAQGPPR